MNAVKVAYLIVNFGGPRQLDEVLPFLEALLTDKEVIRTPFPQRLHNIIFRYVARKRSRKISHDYLSIGGKSPIYADTEEIAHLLRLQLKAPVITFHRYLTATHKAFHNEIAALANQYDELRVFPMFPQYTYATTGSIALWFQKYLPKPIIHKLRWVKSYCSDPDFILAHQKSITDFLKTHKLEEKETVLLFSAHGIPELFVEEGDPYKSECEASFNGIMKGFPLMLGKLCYQSKFGRGEWIKPYTVDLCNEIQQWTKGKKHVVFIPLSFTSDHIETLFEVERDYMSIIRKQGLQAWRVPALTYNSDWIKAIISILNNYNLTTNSMLVRK